MVKFIDVDPTKVDDVALAHRGRVSYPILKAFLETGKFVVQLDRTGMQQSFQGLYSSLGSYIRNHHLPVKLLSRGGQLLLMRLDIDKDGKQIPDWEEKLLMTLVEGEPEEITTEVIDKKFEQEKNKVTK